MKKIFVTLNDKGGVGKSTLCLNLAMVAALRGFDFEYIELDNSNNTSASLSNSSVFKNKMTSVKTSKAQEELFKASWKALKENKYVFIDVGGGLDFNEVASLLKEQFAHHDICFLLPFENSIKQMDNLVNTYNFIDNPEKTYLVKNKVIQSKDARDPFRFFEGDKALGVKSYRKEINPLNKVFEMYLSDSQQLPEITKESMLDLSALARQYTRAEADKEFSETSKDMKQYVELMQEYSKSEMCLKEILAISEEFAELFDDE